MKTVNERIRTMRLIAKDHGHGILADYIHEAFPEAFENEKHWAIGMLIQLKKELHQDMKHGWAGRVDQIIAAFNDDGSLRKEPKP